MRSASGSRTSWPSVAAALSLALSCAACSTSGIRPADIPPCPGIVIQEALLTQPECFSDEALSALAGHCSALRELRR